MTNDTTTMRVRVLPGWLVHHDGEQRGDSEELTVPAEVGRYWQRRGWVEPVERKRRKST